MLKAIETIELTVVLVDELLHFADVEEVVDGVECVVGHDALVDVLALEVDHACPVGRVAVAEAFGRGLTSAMRHPVF